MRSLRSFDDRASKMMRRYLQVACVLTLIVAAFSYIPRRNGIVYHAPKILVNRISHGYKPNQASALPCDLVHPGSNGRDVRKSSSVSNTISKILLAAAATFVSFSKRASAAGTVEKAVRAGSIKGWDLYGRVPYDDFMFTTTRLASPDLLKRSVIEVVTQEIPIVLATFNRKKSIHTGLVLAKGVVCILGGLALLGAIVMKARDSMRRDRQVEAEIRGFYTPVSASYKGARNKGKEVEGVQGWIDMSRRNPRPSEQEEEAAESEGDADSTEEDGKAGREGMESDGEQSDAARGASARDSGGDTHQRGGKPGRPATGEPNKGDHSNDMDKDQASDKNKGKGQENEKGKGKGKDKGSGGNRNGPSGKGPKGKGPSGGSGGKGRNTRDNDEHDDLYDDL